MAARAMDENAEVFDEEPTDVVYMGSPRFEKVYKTALRSSGLNYLLTDISQLIKYKLCSLLEL